jgi:hypothetical protein
VRVNMVGFELLGLSAPADKEHSECAMVETGSTRGCGEAERTATQSYRQPGKPLLTPPASGALHVEHMLEIRPVARNTPLTAPSPTLPLESRSSQIPFGG